MNVECMWLWAHAWVCVGSRDRDSGTIPRCRMHLMCSTSGERCDDVMLWPLPAGQLSGGNGVPRQVTWHHFHCSRSNRCVGNQGHDSTVPFLRQRLRPSQRTGNRRIAWCGVWSVGYGVSGVSAMGQRRRGGRWTRKRKRKCLGGALWSHMVSTWQQHGINPHGASTLTSLAAGRVFRDARRGAMACNREAQRHEVGREGKAA